MVAAARHGRAALQGPPAAVQPLSAAAHHGIDRQTDDLAGKRVDQGLTVYGNKGSTDQHAYVQQLRDGLDNFFVTFIRVLKEGGDSVEVEPGVTPATSCTASCWAREALSGNDRQSMTITIHKVDARTIGVLIALFERAVGFYASLVGINAYHQPGVEAGQEGRFRRPRDADPRARRPVSHTTQRGGACDGDRRARSCRGCVPRA
jgi:hypothetical protein